MNELNWKERKVDEIIIHQVSARNTQLLIEALNLDAEKMFLTFPDLGNIGPAAIPICLAKSLEAGRISKGDRVVVMDYGKKIGDGTPDEVRSNQQVIDAYLGGHA